MTNDCLIFHSEPSKLLDSSHHVLTFRDLILGGSSEQWLMAAVTLLPPLLDNWAMAFELWLLFCRSFKTWLTAAVLSLKLSGEEGKPFSWTFASSFIYLLLEGTKQSDSTSYRLPDDKSCSLRLLFKFIILVNTWCYSLGIKLENKRDTISQCFSLTHDVWISFPHHMLPIFWGSSTGLQSLVKPLFEEGLCPDFIECAYDTQLGSWFWTMTVYGSLNKW